MTVENAKVLIRYFCLLLTFLSPSLLIAQPGLYSADNSSLSQIEILISQQDSKCEGDSVGAINLFLLGGHEPYQFQWNDGSQEQNRTNLPAGVYSVTVTDVNKTTQSTSVTINEGISPSVSLTTVAASCISGVTYANGQLTVLSFMPEYRFDYSIGSSYTGTATTPDGLPSIPANGLLTSALPNPAIDQPYTVRVFNDRGCYTDITTILSPATCECPPAVCIPVMIKKRSNQ